MKSAIVFFVPSAIVLALFATLLANTEKLPPGGAVVAGSGLGFGYIAALKAGAKLIDSDDA